VATPKLVLTYTALVTRKGNITLSDNLHGNIDVAYTSKWTQQRKPGFDPASVHVVEKVGLGQVFPRVLRFSPVNFIPPVLHYTEKRRKLIIFITGLHNKTAVRP
jgi:hypothetical protein